MARAKQAKLDAARYITRHAPDNLVRSDDSRYQLMAAVIHAVLMKGGLTPATRDRFNYPNTAGFAVRMDATDCGIGVSDYHSDDITSGNQVICDLMRQAFKTVLNDGEFKYVDHDEDFLSVTVHVPYDEQLVALHRHFCA